MSKLPAPWGICRICQNEAPEGTRELYCPHNLSGAYYMTAAGERTWLIYTPLSRAEWEWIGVVIKNNKIDVSLPGANGPITTTLDAERRMEQK